MSDHALHNPCVSLAELNPGETAEIVALIAEGVLRRRLLDLGFIVGSRIEVLRTSPFGDPKAYRLRGAVYALRNVHARLVKVRRIS